MLYEAQHASAIMKQVILADANPGNGYGFEDVRHAVAARSTVEKVLANIDAGMYVLHTENHCVTPHDVAMILDLSSIRRQSN